MPLLFGIILKGDIKEIRFTKVEDSEKLQDRAITNIAAELLQQYL